MKLVFICATLCYFGLMLCATGFPPTPKGNYALDIDSDTCVQVICFGTATTLNAQFWVKCGLDYMPSSHLVMDEPRLNVFVVAPQSEPSYKAYIQNVRTGCAPGVTIDDGDMKHLESEEVNNKLRLTFGGSVRTLTFNRTCWTNH